MRAELNQGDGRALIQQADVTDAIAVARMVEAATIHFGQPIDILINNAGTAIHARPFIGTSWEEMQRHLDTQVRGAFQCAQAVLPAMLAARSGRIINIGSIYTWSAPPPQSNGLHHGQSSLARLHQIARR